MDEQSDWAAPLAVVAAVVALTLGGVLTLAVSQAGPAEPLALEANASEPEAPVAQAQLGFAPDSARLPADAQAQLGPLADEARAAPPAQRLFINAGHDGSPAGLALAQQRSQALRHALEANGVPPQRLQRLPDAAGRALPPHEVQVRLR